MSESTSFDQLLSTVRQGIAEQKRAADRETDPVKRARMLRHARSSEDYAEEEAEAIAAEIAEEQLPTSALVRRILTEAMRQPAKPGLSAEQIEQMEQIARRVYLESA